MYGDDVTPLNTARVVELLARTKWNAAAVFFNGARESLALALAKVARSRTIQVVV